jgi:hypothetical protein
LLMKPVHKIMMNMARVLTDHRPEEFRLFLYHLSAR